MGSIASTETRHASGFPGGGAAHVAAFPLEVLCVADLSQDIASIMRARGAGTFPSKYGISTVKGGEALSAAFPRDFVWQHYDNTEEHVAHRSYPTGSILSHRFQSTLRIQPVNVAKASD